MKPSIQPSNHKTTRAQIWITLKRIMRFLFVPIKTLFNRISVLIKHNCNSADADGGPRSRVRTAGHPLSPPSTSAEFFAARVCRVALKKT
jgi:hypothetical protein